MLEKSLFDIEKPGRYIGGEANAWMKSFESADARFALAFPDVYEVGMSHLGLRLLYDTLNRMDGVMADRVYTPWPDFEARLRTLGEPLRGIESGRPLHAFDFVGFSLQYELSYTNILTMLDLGGIPLEAEKRTSEHPWIIAGGPCAFNPEPLADFFDFVVLGEAEEVLGEIVQVFRDLRRSGERSRRDFLEEFSRIEGVYVPSLFRVSYREDGVIAAVEPSRGDYSHVRKRLVLDLDQTAPIPEKPLVPLLDIVHNRLGIEIARGCTRGCRFCQASFIYRPVRERDPNAVFDAAEKSVAAGGFEEISLLSLSTGDYCRIEPLLAALMSRFEPARTAVSLPSMRVGTLTPELMELIRKVRKTGFTLAPEAGSERLRRVINKGINDDDLLQAAESAFSLGWKLIKLYFMMGLPTETQEDLDALTDLCLRVRRLGRRSGASANVSVSTFVPKPQTPFQWSSQLERREMEVRLDGLRDRLRKPGLRFKWHHPDHSVLEAVFARGDRRLGKTLLRAWELGARFDGWTELFRRDIWERAFRDTGIDPAFYAERERSGEEVLPWDHLSTGVEKGYLRKEYERALEELYTADCRRGECSGCGVCDGEGIGPRLSEESVPPVLAAPEVPRDGEEPRTFLYRLRFAKQDRARFFGQLEIAQAFARAVRRAGLPAAYTRGFHPHVKLSFSDALPLGLESLVNEAHLTLTAKMDPRRLRSSLNEQLPGGVSVEEAAYVAARMVVSGKQRGVYLVSGLSPLAMRSILHGWSRRLDETLTKKTKKGVAGATLGEILMDVRQVDESSLEMDLYEDDRIHFRPSAVLCHLLGESSEYLSECRICKTAVSRVTGMEESEDVRGVDHQCRRL